MAKPTLQQVFGINCTEDGSFLTISKTDLATVGLTPSTTNTAESLLMAIILQAGTYLTQASQDNNVDQVLVVEKNSDTLVTRNNQQYREFGYNIQAQKIDTQTVVDPDDF